MNRRYFVALIGAATPGLLLDEFGEIVTPSSAAALRRRTAGHAQPYPRTAGHARSTAAGRP
jgi:hypothetical protein